ncbi:MAG TPA: zinc-ribbon domain-containing protein [Ktedonobacteraceae bacterium]|nr:zinc-ribbon domain-containing protein [Ktedonobacteraceae bacterium]
MQTCTYCGAELPENSRFCGKCGHVQDAFATDASATRITPPPPSGVSDGGTLLATQPPYGNAPAQGNTPIRSLYPQAPTTPHPNQNEDERRSGIPPWSPFAGAALGGEAMWGSGQIAPPGAPVVQGTPQIGNVPSVPGSPSAPPNTPFSHPTLGAGNASPTHPVQGPGNASIGHPAQGPGNVPISHPAQGPVHTPVNYPTHGPTTPYPHPGPHPIHHPPEPPGTHHHHPIHKHHRDHDHDEDEHHHHHDQHAHHTHHIAHASKVAGVSSAKTILIVVVAAAVVAAGGVAAAMHFLAHSPLISITSPYKVGDAPAGASGTTLQISGQQFASNSPITFLLDGHAAPGNPGTHSDANGSFHANVPITDAWSIGTHTLTARDASNNSTQNSVSVVVVQQGQANTPGPDGAPPDDASFKVIAQIQGNQSPETEIVTGHPDPMGGTACNSEDTGKPIVITGSTYNHNVPYRQTATFSCTGNYKAGKITFTETLTSSVTVYSEPDGTTSTCTLNSPQVDEELSGSYTGNNTFSGTVTYPAIPASDFSCVPSGFTAWFTYSQSPWTGQVTDLHR